MTNPSNLHADYKPGSWTNYTIEELGQFIYLLTKRAQHRTDSVKIAKDLYDAYNYLDMMRAKIQAIQSLLGVKVDTTNVKRQLNET